ncbi:hypothetical protein, partial [Klebsiella pneumoniae]|uniref:hypothetical protein n=1 Tax=Klebsiella pneumoniae TaxID=573 RepID=UPI003A8604AF
MFDAQVSCDGGFPLSISGDAAISTLIIEPDISDGQNGTVRSNLHIISQWLVVNFPPLQHHR